MTLNETLAALEQAGTAQNRKVYGRHGVKPPMFGVSYANLGKLTKRIKVDHELAQQLWESGNHDARILATKVADPARATGKLLEAWRKDLDNYVLTDAFAQFAAKTPQAASKARQWSSKKAEWTARSGWLLTAILARRPEHEANYEQLLGTIESEIHGARNRARDAMNSALIAIGIQSPALRKKAIAAARRIGKVEVDHGETGCKTPDAKSYILKAAARKKR